MTVCHFGVTIESYIAHPYWEQQEQVINIIKESGTARARSAMNRDNALTAYLEKLKMTREDFEELKRLAARPFHTDVEGYIIIPKRSVDGMLTQAADTARAALRAVRAEQVRTSLRATSWLTNTRPEEAKVWKRFVVVTGGGGMKLSNQRALRENLYVGEKPPDDQCEPGPAVEATGSVEIDPEMVSPDKLYDMLKWAGSWVGIGASRKMGWGRFSIHDWTVV